MRPKTIENPWIAKGIIKFCKKKHRLYERVLEKYTPQN